MKYPMVSEQVCLPVWPTPEHAVLLQAQGLQMYTAAAYPYGLGRMSDFSTETQAPAPVTLTYTSQPGLGGGLGIPEDKSLPEVTSLEDAMRMFQYSPEAAIAWFPETLVEPEQKAPAEETSP
ncbi:hypothetical protein P4O66_000219 [Electrophorus voltai]|uniref:Uncharacterized protein n=1 Tax=Electrophorus voltai TaxID=2609070 RepID=A0AAD8ZJ79_9TELE|nr:hypothetical protein P4O66_000219 [Electrophorus voltai]